MTKRPAKKSSKSAKKAGRKTSKPKAKTFKSLQSAARALKRKAKKPVKLGRFTPSQADVVIRRVEAARPIALVTPKGLPARPADTRWPKEIRVGKRHRKDFGNLKDLAASVDARGGLLQPIAITSSDDLIAGERRMKCWPLTRFKDQPIPVRVIDVDSIIAGEWDENAKRKDFTPSEAAAISDEIERQLKTMAKERQRSGKKVDDKDKGRAGEHAARATGFARRTIDKAKAVVNAAKSNPEKFGKLQSDMDRTGKVDGPFKRLSIMLQTQALRDAPPPLPMLGPYGVMVVDFPVTGDVEKDQETIDATGRSFRGYPEMSIEECAKFARQQLLPILAPNCSVWLTFPNFHIVNGSAHKVIAGFGAEFTAATMLTWKKDKLGRGKILRDQTEHAIVIYRGEPTFNCLGEDPPTTFLEAVRRENSRKPDELYDRVERVCPAPRYAEIFSRGGRNDKWDCHGDQAGKFAPSVAKAAQEAVLKEIQLPPDEQLKRVLEAVEKGETPDLRLVAKDVGKQLDRMIDGKKKFKLTASGRSTLAQMREDMRFAALISELPSEPEALTEAYRVALKTRHDAVVADDDKAVESTDERVEAIVSKWQNGGDVRVNLTERMGGRLSGSPRFEKLYRAVAAPVGSVPLWGQQGLFPLDVDGLPCLVHVTHDLEITVFATDPEKPFVDETGAEMFGWGFMDLAYDREFRGKTVDQFIAGEVRKMVKDMTPPKKPKPVAKGMPNPYLVVPKQVFALPAEWDGKSEPKPVKAGQAKARSGKSAKPEKAKADAKPVRRTLPGRDHDLIAFAEACGHIVTRTVDHATDSKVATCECGWAHSLKELTGTGEEAGKARQAQARIMDETITRHWQLAREQSGIKPDDFTEWLLLTAVQAGRDGGLGVGARMRAGLIKRKRSGQGYGLTDAGETRLRELDTVITAARGEAHPDAHRTLFGQVFNEMPATATPTADEPAAKKPDGKGEGAAVAAVPAGRKRGRAATGAASVETTGAASVETTGAASVETTGAASGPAAPSEAKLESETKSESAGQAEGDQLDLPAFLDRRDELTKAEAAE